MKKNNSNNIENKNKSYDYLPKERDYYYESNEKISSEAPNGDVTMIPNPATDPIVTNNIAWMEFDYTDSMADRLNEYEDIEHINKNLTKHKK